LASFAGPALLAMQRPERPDRKLVWWEDADDHSFKKLIEEHRAETVYYSDLPPVILRNHDPGYPYWILPVEKSRNAAQRSNEIGIAIG